MSQLRTNPRRGGLLLLLTGALAIVPVVVAGAASAQTTHCPAGAAGGAGGEGGVSRPGNAGLAFSVPGFGTTTAQPGNVSARPGDGGSARGGDGGRGGSGTLPICNQNTNGDKTPAVVTAAPAGTVTNVHGVTSGGGGGGGTGGGLARTGARTYTEMGIAGAAFVLGGALLLFGQPLRRSRRQ